MSAPVSRHALEAFSERVADLPPTQRLAAVQDLIAQARALPARADACYPVFFGECRVVVVLRHGYLVTLWRDGDEPDRRAVAHGADE
jgi:hypothetical protein